MGDVFKALADETRRAILDELADRDEQTLFEICSRLLMKHGLGSSRQAVSQHLEVLEAAGLVHSERRGRYKFHTLDTTPLAQIAERWPPTPTPPPTATPTPTPTPTRTPTPTPTPTQESP